MPQLHPTFRMTRLLAFAGAMFAVAAMQPAVAQSPAARGKGTASSDSAIYAAFFETLNRQPHDTVFAEEQSIVFQGISPHYDSVAPGLAVVLAQISAPPHKTATLHLPPPIVILSAATPQAVRDRAVNGSPGQAPYGSQGVRGVWQLSPIAYSRDGGDAMFYYRLVCGGLCGEETVVWATRDSRQRWQIKRTAILTIS